MVGLLRREERVERHCAARARLGGRCGGGDEERVGRRAARGGDNGADSLKQAAVSTTSTSLADDQKLRNEVGDTHGSSCDWSHESPAAIRLLSLSSYASLSNLNALRLLLAIIRTSATRESTCFSNQGNVAVMAVRSSSASRGVCVVSCQSDMKSTMMAIWTLSS